MFQKCLTNVFTEKKSRNKIKALIILFEKKELLYHLNEFLRQGFEGVHLSDPDPEHTNLMQ